MEIIETSLRHEMLNSVDMTDKCGLVHLHAMATLRDHNTTCSSFKYIGVLSTCSIQGTCWAMSNHYGLFTC